MLVSQSPGGVLQCCTQFGRYIDSRRVQVSGPSTPLRIRGHGLVSKTCLSGSGGSGHLLSSPTSSLCSPQVLKMLTVAASHWRSDVEVYDLMACAGGSEDQNVDGLANLIPRRSEPQWD